MRPVLILIALLTAPTPGCSDIVIDCDAPDAPGWDPAHAPVEEEMLAAVNARREAGAECRGTAMPPVPPVTMEERLRCAARSHSVDMSEQRYFDHTSPSGAGPSQRVDAVGYDWSTVSENIAAGREEAEATVDDLMDSTTGHCENIMDGDVSEAGIGLAFTDDDYGHYWTQVFAAPR